MEPASPWLCRVVSIREVRGSDTTIKYDYHTETVTINVVDDGNGNLTLTSSADGAMPLFENSSKPGTLTVTKAAEGGNTDDTYFTFEITFEDDFGAPLESTPVILPLSPPSD